VNYQNETHNGKASKSLHWIYTAIGERYGLVYIFVSRSLILINSK